MKFRALLPLLPLLALCACGMVVPRTIDSEANATVYVVSTVSSDHRVENPAVGKTRPLLFVPASGSNAAFNAENKLVVEACRRAARALGWNVQADAKSCSDCMPVLSPHRFETLALGTSRSAPCGSLFGKSYADAGCNTYRAANRTNNRWIGLTLLAPGSTKAIHQVDVYSTGATASVVEVAAEMCYAGLKTLPDEVSAREIPVSRGLEVENETRAN